MENQHGATVREQQLKTLKIRNMQTLELIMRLTMNRQHCGAVEDILSSRLVSLHVPPVHVSG